MMNMYFYLAFLPLHMFGAIALFNSLNPVLVFVFWVLLSGYGVGVTLHRLLSHKAFETYPTVKNILSLLSCFCVQGSPLFWVTVHRGYHHKHSDKEKDIHSPIHGKLWAYLLWPIQVEIESLNFKYAPDLLRSKFQMFLNQEYFFIVWFGWVIALAISPTVFFSLVVAQLIAMHAEFCVNLFCHTNLLRLGYRNFNTDDNSRNYWLFGLLSWGIGYHNNHHANPKNVSFAHRKFEFDPTVLLVKLVSK